MIIIGKEKSLFCRHHTTNKLHNAKNGCTSFLHIRGLDLEGSPFFILFCEFQSVLLVSTMDFVAQTDKSWSRSHQLETPSSPSTSPSPPILQVKMTICPQCFYSRDGICRINVFKTISIKKSTISLQRNVYWVLFFIMPVFSFFLQYMCLGKCF